MRAKASLDARASKDRAATIRADAIATTIAKREEAEAKRVALVSRRMADAQDVFDKYKADCRLSTMSWMAERASKIDAAYLMFVVPQLPLEALRASRKADKISALRYCP